MKTPKPKTPKPKTPKPKTPIPHNFQISNNLDTSVPIIHCINDIIECRKHCHSFIQIFHKMTLKMKLDGRFINTYVLRMSLQLWISAVTSSRACSLHRCQSGEMELITLSRWGSRMFDERILTGRFSEFEESFAICRRTARWPRLCPRKNCQSWTNIP